MTFQYTEHPTPKFKLLIGYTKFTCNDDRSIDTPLCLCQERNKEALSKCERIEVVNMHDNVNLFDIWFPKTKGLKDGDTFEIDDEKVSVEIGDTCDTSCSHGYKCECIKIATLKLKEIDEDKMLADGVKKMIKEAPVIATFRLKETVKEETNYNEELLIKMWYNRMPAHEINASTGKDMFWYTAFLVFEDYIKEIEKLKK